MDEFELIRRYFVQPSGDAAVLVGVGDDGAVLRPAAGLDLVVVADTQIEAVHYPRTLGAEDVGFRSVAVNLSDLAAMGARPRWMTLALTLAEANPDWLRAFSTGLRLAAGAHGVALVGGDTTRADQTVVTVQLIGELEPSRRLLRSTARCGDRIFVSGTVGDAAAGLKLITTDAVSDPATRNLAERFRRPASRVAFGSRIAPVASAAIDVSDGLYADLNKLLQASGCGGRISLGRLPLSDDIQEVFDMDAARRFALSGGDDYELCFTAPAEAERELRAIADETAVPIARIGEVVDGEGLICTDGGEAVAYDDAGYSHF